MQDIRRIWDRPAIYRHIEDPGGCHTSTSIVRVSGLIGLGQRRGHSSFRKSSKMERSQNSLVRQSSFQCRAELGHMSTFAEIALPPEQASPIRCLLTPVHLKTMNNAPYSAFFHSQALCTSLSCPHLKTPLTFHISCWVVVGGYRGLDKHLPTPR